MLLYVLFNISNVVATLKTKRTALVLIDGKKGTKVLLLVVYSCQNSSYFHLRVLMK